MEDVSKLPVPTPTTRHSFVGKTVEEAAKFMLGALQGIKEWSESDFEHTHRNEDGEEYECQQLSCDWRFWHHPEVEDVMKDYAVLDKWASKDPEKFNSLVLLKIRKDQKAVDGKIVAFLGRRIQMKKIYKIALMVLTGTGVAGGLFGIVVSVL